MARRSCAAEGSSNWPRTRRSGSHRPRHMELIIFSLHGRIRCGRLDICSSRRVSLVLSDSYSAISSSDLYWHPHQYRSPYLIYYTCELEGALKLQGSIQLSGNVLDLSTDEANTTIFVSVDCVREAGSTQTWRSKISPDQALVESFSAKWDQGCLQWEPVTDPVVSNINSQGTLDLPVEADQKELNESLYNLEHLRKRAYNADDE